MSTKKRNKLDTKQRLGLTFPAIPPQIGIKDYYASKCTKLLVKPPLNCGDNIDSLKMNRITAKRDLLLTENKLALDRMMKIRQRRHLDKSWKSVRNMVQYFRSCFETFEKFVQENDEKRLRSRAKFDYFSSLYRQRVVAIQELQTKYDALHEVKQKFEAMIAKYVIYEDYLGCIVLAAAPEFRIIYDIVRRHDALMEFKRLNSQCQAQQEKELLKMREEYAAMVTTKKLLLVGLSNQAGTLHVKYGRAKLNSWKWESIVSHILKELSDRTEEIHAVKQAIHKLYELICERKKLQPDPHVTIDMQLRFVKGELLDINNILVNMRANK